MIKCFVRSCFDSDFEHDDVEFVSFLWKVMMYMIQFGSMVVCHGFDPRNGSSCLWKSFRDILQRNFSPCVRVRLKWCAISTILDLEKEQN